MANYFYKGKEVRSRSDRDRDVKLSWAHTVTLKHTDINFRVTDSVSNNHLDQKRENSDFPSDISGFAFQILSTGDNDVM